MVLPHIVCQFIGLTMGHFDFDKQQKNPRDAFDSRCESAPSIETGKTNF